MERKSKTQLSPVCWNLIAVSAIGATLYESICLISMSPTTTCRVGFALSGLIAVAACRRAMRTHASHWNNAIHFLVVTLCLVLVPALLLPIFARSGSRRNRATPQGNLRQIALGLYQYAQDYDGYLPPPIAESGMRAALAPYLKSESLWEYADRSFIKINPVVLGYSLSDFKGAPDGTSTAVLAFTPQQETLLDGLEYRFVAFTDANVRYISDPRFQSLLHETEQRTTGSPLPARNKP